MDNLNDNADKFALMGILILVVVSIVVLFFCCGCANLTASKTCANGDKWDVTSTRLLWKTEHVTVKAPDGTVVEVSQTEPDTQAITATGGAIGAIAGTAAAVMVKEIAK